MGRGLGWGFLKVDMPDLSVNLAGLRLTNPTMTCSGTCGYAFEYADYTELRQVGVGARRRVMAALDDDSGRCASGHSAVRVHRLARAAGDDVHRRVAAVEAAREAGATIVLIDRLTEGLAAPDRRTVLAALRPVATGGRAVLVDDDDPVAALAVADGALRADPAGGLSAESLGDLDYLAS